jgi:hypothetical protein
MIKSVRKENCVLFKKIFIVNIRTAFTGMQYEQSSSSSNADFNSRITDIRYCHDPVYGDRSTPANGNAYSTSHGYPYHHPIHADGGFSGCHQRSHGRLHGSHHEYLGIL